MFLFWKIMFRTIFENWYSFLFRKMGTLQKKCFWMPTMPKMYCNTQHSPSAYSQTVRQSCSHTVMQSYSHTVMQSYSQTVIQSYSHTVIQLYSHTVRQSYSHTVHCSVNMCGSRPWAALMCCVTMCAATSQPMRGLPPPCDQWEAAREAVIGQAGGICWVLTILTIDASRVSARRSRSTGEKTKE